MSTRLFAVGAVVLLSAALVALPVASAQAHDQLISSSPAEGEQLEVAPSEVSLRFDADLLPLGAVVLAVDADGRDWVVGDVAINGTTVTVPLDPDMPVAGYEIRWRVVSGDGHPISDLIPFTVGDAEAFSSLNNAEGASSGTTSGQQQDQASTEPNATIRLVLIGAGGAVFAVLVFIAIIYFGRRKAPLSTKENE